eukprot:m.1457 g.1457  ORF g.1457 m.1457 type:complete len:50 (-) comp500_c0_seq1:185-334(-)
MFNTHHPTPPLYSSNHLAMLINFTPTPPHFDLTCGRQGSDSDLGHKPEL